MTGHDCGFCHTQAGASTVAGTTGKEWAQARFHANFTAAASALVINGTTGRCSNCHMNDKPGAAYAGQDHSTFRTHREAPTAAPATRSRGRAACQRPTGWGRRAASRR